MQASRIADTDAVWRKIVNGYQWGAKKKSLKWGLAFAETRAILESGCTYCGRTPRKVRVRGHEVSVSGIDRINNDLGYVHGNCDPCCKDCNFAKRGRTKVEFLAWIRMLIKD